MKQSLKEFMREIIDYAGLFPPADLPLDTSIRNYARYKKGEDAWMLSRFIIPASRLEELEPYGDELFAVDPPFVFSVLGKGTDTIAEYEEVVDKAIKACRDFCDAHAEAVKTDLLEMKLPKETAFSHDVDLLEQVMDETAEKLNHHATTPDTIFYEGFFNESWRKDIEIIMQAIAEHNAAAKSMENYANAGYKIRCGGVVADLFPSTEQVAFVLSRARAYDVPVKGTAGLHHPVRHYDESVKTKMHGFFNVFGGALLGYAHDLNDDELEAILREEDPEQFLFADKAFCWKDYAIKTEEIKSLRDAALLSYGSCSFEEPIDDLKKLQLF